MEIFHFLIEEVVKINSGQTTSFQIHMKIKLVKGRLYLLCQQSLFYIQIFVDNSVTFKWQISSSPQLFGVDLFDSCSTESIKSFTKVVLLI